MKHARLIPSTAIIIATLLVPSVVNAKHTFTTIDIPGAVSTVAAGINGQGDIVGYYTDSGGHQHGFLRGAHGWVPIDYPGSCRSDALGINEDGDIVGTWFPQPAPGRTCPTSNQVPGIHGYLLRDGQFTSIDVPGATFTGPIDINAEGDIVGHFGLPGRMNVFLLRDGVITTYADPEAERLGKMTCGFGINPQGEIVGHFSDNNGTHGFMLNESGFTTIDYPGVTTFLQAYGINASGEIVGLYYDSAWMAHGFVRDAAGVMSTFDVDLPGASNTVVWRSNARGDLVGKYTDATGNHGFLIQR